MSKWKDRNQIAILLKDQRAMLLNLAQMKLWHLARQHVNSDSAVRHSGASLFLKDKASAFQYVAVKDWWRPVVKEDVDGEKARKRCDD